MADTMFGGIPDPEPTLGPERSAWVFAIVLGAILALILTLVLMTPKSIPWAIGQGNLQIHAKVWNDDIPLRDLRPDLALVIDLNREPGWNPVHKLWGVNGFGLNAGRFRLQNGRTADIYLTNETTVVLIPHRGDVPVIVGVRDPQPLLDALKNAAK